MSKRKTNTLDKLSKIMTIKLITEVKNHPCLWNSSDPDHSNRHVISKTWKNIAAELDLPADFIRAKWKNLRDLYKRILKKCETPESNHSSWQYFKMFHFLNADTGNRRCSNNEDSDDSEAEVVFETLYDDESETEEVQSSQEDPIETAVPEKKRRIEVEDVQNDDEDYDILFLKSLVPYFRKLDTMRKLVVRSRMQDMLMNELAAQKSQGFKKALGDV